MEAVLEGVPVKAQRKRLNLFERYLSLWVAGCMATGIFIGKAVPDRFRPCATWNSETGATSIFLLPY